MAGKEGQDGGAAEWLDALSGTLMRQVDRAADQLKEAKLENGDVAAAERHARAVGAIALAARRTFALKVELAQMRAAASGDHGEDMDDIQGEDDPVEMEWLQAELQRRLDVLRAQIERKRADGWPIVGRGAEEGGGGDAAAA